MIPLEFEVLWKLAHWGPLAAVELRDMDSRPGASWQLYSAKLRSLEQRGLVDKGDDPAGFIWYLTERGREVVEL